MQPSQTKPPEQLIWYLAIRSRVMKRENAGKRSFNFILSFLRRALLIQIRSKFWMIIVFLFIRVLRVLIATSLSVPINCQVLSYLQMDATIPNIAGTTMLGVVASVLAVVCKRMQQLPTMLQPAQKNIQ